ncbi:LysR family transcriptional regulator [Chondromyces apiculatus]|uniref:Transcriptional regulator, LysR family n=1 Tax=Chondromyces apiculatus DSM 436 TaxID=1192034 RepID=A0A017T6W8_9BACT|nr:Transcriptional regulator, LysR family [Chondromyces apiculatus DSM 436]
MAHDPRLLNGLAVLAAIVESGNFARAAEVLGMTPSGVSRAVGRLEQRLGVRLFDRSPRAVVLTEEGRRLHEGVAPLLDGIEDAATEAAGASREVRGRLRVHVDAAFGHLVLGPSVGAFLAQHPGVSLDYAVRERLGDLDAEGFDVAVRFGVPEMSSLTCRKLFETRVLTCAAPAYVARHGRPAHPRDLAGHECIHFRNPVTGMPFAWELRRGEEVVPVEVSGRLTVNDAGALMDACLSGHGIAQPLEVFARERIAAGKLVQLLPEWADERFPAYALHRSRTLASARVRAFLEFVVALTRGGVTR